MNLHPHKQIKPILHNKTEKHFFYHHNKLNKENFVSQLSFIAYHIGLCTVNMLFRSSQKGLTNTKLFFFLFVADIISHNYLHTCTYIHIQFNFLIIKIIQIKI